MNRCVCLVVLALLSTAARGGDLTIQFVYDGPVPPQPNLAANGAFCAGLAIPDDSRLIDPETHGIANVLVYVYTGRGGVKVNPPPAQAKTVEMANKNCRFQPRMVVLRTGDTLEVTNPDPVGHNCNLSFLNGGAQNFLLPAGKSKSIGVVAQPAPIPVECNIHPWMKGYVVVLDHPYAALSGTDGKLTIKDLPEQELTFRVYIEAANGALGAVDVNGKTQEWKRNRFELTIGPGQNDMGVVKLKPGQL